MMRGSRARVVPFRGGIDAGRELHRVRAQARQSRVYWFVRLAPAATRQRFDSSRAVQVRDPRCLRITVGRITFRGRGRPSKDGLSAPTRQRLRRVRIGPVLRRPQRSLTRRSSLTANGHEYQHGLELGRYDADM
jgi:hypothetical protein